MSGRSRAEKAEDRGGVIVAVDPGRDKCGLALLDGRGRVLRRAIVPRVRISEIASWWAAAEKARVVVGRGTTARQAAEELESHGVNVELVDEAGTTMEGRALYWEANPPKGWRRIVPRSFLVPPVPVDDWAAVALGRRYLRAKTASSEETGMD